MLSTEKSNFKRYIHVLNNLGPGRLSIERSKEAFISTSGIENNKSYNQKKIFPFFLFFFDLFTSRRIGFLIKGF